MASVQGNRSVYFCNSVRYCMNGQPACQYTSKQ